MTITDDLISTSVWTAIRAKLVAANIITTNPTTSATTAVNIYASYNDKNSARPLLLIDPANVSVTPNKFGGNKRDINVVMKAITDFSVECDQIDEQVMASLVADNIEGINLTSIESTHDIPTEPYNVKFHSKTISVAYNRE